MTSDPEESCPGLLLASRSPRRLLLLREAGYEVDTIATFIDDGELTPGRVTVPQWTAALAHLKARAAAHHSVTPRANALIIGSDTVVEVDDRIIGQPRDADHAREIIIDLSNREHDVITGVSIIHVATGREDLFVDIARVTVGDIPADSIEQYIATGQWRGKAGAYNLSERLAAGWPIQYQGDPATIMGLPMQRLTHYLARRWNITPQPHANPPSAT